MTSQAEQHRTIELSDDRHVDPDVRAFVRGASAAGTRSLLTSEVVLGTDLPDDVVRRSLFLMHAEQEVLGYVEVPSRITGRPLHAAAFGMEMPRTYTDIDGTSFDVDAGDMIVRFALTEPS